MFFEGLGLLESYHPRKQLRMQLARIMALNLLNLYALIFALFDKIGTMNSTLICLKKNITNARDFSESHHSLVTLIPQQNESDQFITSTIVAIDQFAKTTFNNISDIFSSSVMPEVTTLSSLVTDCIRRTINCPKPTQVFTQTTIATAALLLNSSPDNIRMPTKSYTNVTNAYEYSTMVSNLSNVTFDYSMENITFDLTMENSSFYGSENLTDFDVIFSTIDSIDNNYTDFPDEWNEGHVIKRKPRNAENKTFLGLIENSVYDTIAELFANSEEDTINSTSFDLTAFDVNSIAFDINSTDIYNSTVHDDNETAITDNITVYNEYTESSSIRETSEYSITESTTFDDTTESEDPLDYKMEDFFYDSGTDECYVLDCTIVEELTSPDYGTSSDPTWSTPTDNYDITTDSSETLFPSVIPLENRTGNLIENDSYVENTTHVHESLIRYIGHMDQAKQLELRKLCWETMFGQELVKLTVMDLVATVASTICMDFFRALFVRFFNKFWCWDLEKRYPKVIA